MKDKTKLAQKQRDTIVETLRRAFPYFTNITMIRWGKQILENPDATFPDPRRDIHLAKVLPTSKSGRSRESVEKFAVRMVDSYLHGDISRTRSMTTFLRKAIMVCELEEGHTAVEIIKFRKKNNFTMP